MLKTCIFMGIKPNKTLSWQCLMSWNVSLQWLSLQYIPDETNVRIVTWKGLLTRNISWKCFLTRNVKLTLLNGMEYKLPIQSKLSTKTTLLKSKELSLEADGNLFLQFSEWDKSVVGYIQKWPYFTDGL